MKYASIRDIRNRPATLRDALDDDLVTLTTNGKPFAVVVGLRENEDPAELERLFRQARAQQAVSRIRARWQESGTPLPDADDIEAEISEARAARRR